MALQKNAQGGRWRTPAPQESASKVEIDLNVRSEHKRIVPGVARADQFDEPPAEHALGLALIEHLELCRSHRLCLH